MDGTKLTRISKEKKANILSDAIRYLGSKNVPLLSGYSKNITKQLLDPISRKGLTKGLGGFVGKQFKVTPYRKSLQSKFLDINRELSRLTSMPKPSTTQLSQVKKLQSEANVLGQKLKSIDLTKSQGKSLIGSMMTELRRPGLSLSDRSQILKNMSKVMGHYGLEGANVGFMYGMPALGAHSVLTAPEGERFKTLGSVLGESAGFIGGGPIGLIPSIAGSTLGSYMGGGMAEALGEKISPDSPYRKLVKALGPEKTTLLRKSLPGMIKGTLEKGDILGATPTTHLRPNRPNLL